VNSLVPALMSCGIFLALGKPAGCACISHIWEDRAQLPPRNGAGPTVFWKSNILLDTPDCQSVQSQGPVTTLETAHFAPPAEVQ
jgi:hypothetical protein